MDNEITFRIENAFLPSKRVIVIFWSDQNFITEVKEDNNIKRAIITKLSAKYVI